MSSTSIRRGANGHPSLSMLPPEVAIKTFSQLSSFSDVFALSTVCRRLRNTWLENVTPIYDQLAPKDIEYEQVARRFLVDQRGPSLESPMFAKDVMRMIRNVIVVEKAILQFEREIVSRVRMDGLEPGEFYGAGAEEHPLTLTRTERERFIHTYYSLWGLLRIDTSAWDSRLQAMTSRELYYLHEMTKLTQSIGREETVPPPIYPNATSDSVNSTNHGRSEKRDAVERRVWQQIQHNSLLFFDRDALHAAVFAKHEGALEFVAIWDHWQPSLKEMVLHESRSTIKLSSAVKKEHFWNDE